MVSGYSTSRYSTMFLYLLVQPTQILALKNKAISRFLRIPLYVLFIYMCIYIFLIYINLFYFIYFWLHWVFVAACGFSLAVVSGGHSSLRCAGFSLWWLLLLRSTGSRCAGFNSRGSWAL